MVLEAWRRSGLRCHDVSRREFVKPRPLRDGAPIEARLTDDSADAIAGDLQGFQPIEHAGQDGTAARPGQLLVFRQRRQAPMAAACTGRKELGGCDICERRRPGRARGTAQLLLDRLAEFCSRWKRSATCRTCGAPRRAPLA